MANVMIVDDSVYMLKNLKTIFEKLGHIIVAEATNGLDAVVRCKINEPDLVTLDINMPGTDGLLALKRIKQIFPNIKVIIISSVGTSDKVLEAIEIGASNYIMKPINEYKIKEVLVKIFNNDNSFIEYEKPVINKKVEIPFLISEDVNEMKVTLNDSFEFDMFPLLDQGLKNSFSDESINTISFTISNMLFKDEKIKIEINKKIELLKILGKEIKINK